MMGCVIYPLIFVLAMELILRGAANTSKGVMTNEHLILPPSRAFVDNIIILLQSKIAADGLLQRHYDLFTRARMKAKPKKKSWSLPLVGGSVREIYFKFGGDTIPTVSEKSVKSLGRLYSILLTDRHRGTGVQKVVLKLKLIKLVYLERWRLGVTNMVFYPVFCGPYRCMWLRYLTLSGFNSIARSNYVSGLEFFLVFRK